MGIYANIQTICEERNISIAELERQCGFERGSVYKWDKNIPSVIRAKTVADFLGVPVEDLLKDENEKAQ